jgi:alanine racemase
VDYLGVAFSQEALSLRAHGIKTPMLVMNAEPDQFISLAETGCEVELYARHQLLPFMALAGKELTLRLHIKVDTGMHRLGFRPDEVPALMEELVKVPNIEVTGVFSHLSSADLPEEESFTLGQLALFDAAVKVVRRHYPTVLAHILNTHGIPKYAQHGYDMVRLGLGLYGVGSYDGLAALEEVVHWKCRISQIGTLLPGDSLGYGRSFIASKPTQYATLPLGYADGLSRQLSNGKGAVYINGQRCSILGRICMDMVMVDCTEMNVQAGDEVEIIGPHQRAAQLAKDGNTIAYEVLTSIGARVPRIYIKD